MDYIALKNFIEINYPSYVKDGEDGLILSALLSPSGKTKIGSISRQLFKIWSAKTGMRAVIEDLSKDVTSPLRSSALALKDFLQGSDPSLDLNMNDNMILLDTS